MADLKEYRYTVNGVTTTALLNDHDAKALGAVLVAEVHRVDVDAKARTDVHTAARAASNKAR